MGQEFSIEAGSEIMVSEEVANHWKAKIHPFLMVEEAPIIVQEFNIAGTTAEIIEEPKEEVKEEVVEVKPKKVIKIKKVK